MKPLFALLGCAFVLSGCVTATRNPQSPTPTEQRLRNHAAEVACARLDLRLARGTAVYLQVDAGDDSPAGKYLAAACAAHLAGRGVALVDALKATVIVRLRISAAGIEDTSKAFGMPAMTVPAVPGTALHQPTTTPELSILSEFRRAGVAEFYATAIDRTGRLIAAVGPIAATTIIHSGALLTGLSFGQQTALPGILKSSR